MPKRKDIVESDEDDAVETSDEFEEEKPTKQAKGKVTAKKPTYKDSESEEEERPIKKKKSAKASPPKQSRSSPEGGPTSVKSNSDGEKYLDLGKKKRVTVRSFKGAALVDIREFYGQEGDEKPGKKGIALSPEQWEALKDNAETIDYLLKRLKK